MFVYLGNTCVRFVDKNGDGLIQVDTTDEKINELTASYHYYPFGMMWEGGHYRKDPNNPPPTQGNFFAPQDVKNKYRYNGKEFIEDFDIGLYDYGARWYDPRIGRFIGVDLLAEITPSWSSNNYVQNMPINAIDPFGLSCMGCGKNGEDIHPPEINGQPMYIGSKATDYPEKPGKAGDKYSDSDGDFVHDGNGWVDQSNGSYVLPTVKISASRSSIMYSSYASAASGILTTAGELKHSGRFGLGIWMGKNGKFYSQSAAAGKARPFYGNQYTGSINEAKSIARPLKIFGAAFGAINYGSTFYGYSQGNITTTELVGETSANTITTFGGIYGVAFGLGWELGRAITNTNVFQEYVLKKQGGKDGLLSTPQ